MTRKIPGLESRKRFFKLRQDRNFQFSKSLRLDKTRFLRQEETGKPILTKEFKSSRQENFESDSEDKKSFVWFRLI